MYRLQSLQLQHVATRQISRPQNVPKYVCGRGSAPNPNEEPTALPQSPQLDLRGLLRGGEGECMVERQGMEGSERKRERQRGLGKGDRGNGVWDFVPLAKISAGTHACIQTANL